MIYIRESVHGAAASWYAVMRHSIKDYETFEEVFIDEYCSREGQLALWGQFMVADRARDIRSYKEYFCNWYQKMKY